MAEAESSNASWIPRDDRGRFIEGYRRCRECDGTGVVEEFGPVRDDFEGDAPDYSDLTVVEIECQRCVGRGAEHTDGCPRCGGDLTDEGVMPSSARRIACHNCGWWDLVG